MTCLCVHGTSFSMRTNSVDVIFKIGRAVVGKSKVDDEVLDNLEEILVTASRRVESLQEVAMSVSAFSTDF